MYIICNYNNSLNRTYVYIWTFPVIAIYTKSFFNSIIMHLIYTKSKQFYSPLAQTKQQKMLPHTAAVNNVRCPLGHLTSIDASHCIFFTSWHPLGNYYTPKRHKQQKYEQTRNMNPEHCITPRSFILSLIRSRHTYSHQGTHRLSISTLTHHHPITHGTKLRPP